MMTLNQTGTCAIVGVHQMILIIVFLYLLGSFFESVHSWTTTTPIPIHYKYHDRSMPVPTSFLQPYCNNRINNIDSSQSRQRKDLFLFQSSNYEEEEGINNDMDNNEPPKLVLNQDDIRKEMYQYKSKYPTSEIDYLAASKQRALQKKESIVNQATDDDWKQIAQDKQNMGLLVDDWENSKNDVGGNMDSQILFFPDAATTTDGGTNDGDNNNNDNDEPKLLLF